MCKALERGLTLPAAAARGGIHYTTLWRWRREFLEFDLAVRLALGLGRAALEERAVKEGNPLRILAVRYPEAWGERIKADVTVTDTSEEDPRARLARLKSLAAALESGLAKETTP